jgi:hypothetical protein
MLVKEVRISGGLTLASAVDGILRASPYSKFHVDRRVNRCMSSEGVNMHTFPKKWVGLGKIPNHDMASMRVELMTLALLAPRSNQLS